MNIQKFSGLPYAGFLISSSEYLTKIIILLNN